MLLNHALTATTFALRAAINSKINDDDNNNNRGSGAITYRWELGAAESRCASASCQIRFRFCIACVNVIVRLAFVWRCWCTGGGLTGRVCPLSAAAAAAASAAACTASEERRLLRCCGESEEGKRGRGTGDGGGGGRGVLGSQARRTATTCGLVSLYNPEVCAHGYLR